MEFCESASQKCGIISLFGGILCKLDRITIDKNTIVVDIKHIVVDKKLNQKSFVPWKLYFTPNMIIRNRQKAMTFMRHFKLQ